MPNKTFCVTFWKQYNDGREAQKSYDIVRAHNYFDARAQFNERVKTCITDFSCDSIVKIRFWREVDDAVELSKAVSRLSDEEKQKVLAALEKKFMKFEKEKQTPLLDMDGSYYHEVPRHD